MKKIGSCIAFGLAFVVAGCAIGPVSTLPTIDASRIDNGKVLSAAEITEAIRGKQMLGNIIRANGNNVQNVVHIYEADGTLRGMVPPRYSDVGKWHVTESTNELCWAWIRWFSDCSVVSVRDGKLHMVNVRGTVFLQR